MHANTIELNNRILRSDGAIGVAPEQVSEMIIRGIPISKIYVTKINEEIERFNRLSDERLELFTDENIKVNLDWILPEEFKSIDLDKYVQDIIDELPSDIHEIGEIRLNNELQEFKRRNLTDFLRTVIYVVSEFKSKGVIFGVGRGSSCASYLLYKIGLHCVDSLKYNISLTEFFHD